MPSTVEANKNRELTLMYEMIFSISVQFTCSYQKKKLCVSDKALSLIIEDLALKMNFFNFEVCEFAEVTPPFWDLVSCLLNDIKSLFQTAVVRIY